MGQSSRAFVQSMANSHNGRSARAEVTASMAISAQSKRRPTPGWQAVLSHQLLAHVAAADRRGRLLRLTRKPLCNFPAAPLSFGTLGLHPLRNPRILPYTPGVPLRE